MMAALATASAALEASCYCGAVRLRIADAVARPPIATSICHCGTCRSLTGAPFLQNVMLPAEQLELSCKDGGEPELVELATSKHVRRRRCAKCHSPVVALLGKDRVVVPASLFAAPHPEAWAPQHHLYYSSRTLDVNDGLPKYSSNFGGAFWTPDVPDVLADGGSGGGDGGGDDAAPAPNK